MPRKFPSQARRIPTPRHARSRRKSRRPWRTQAIAAVVPSEEELMEKLAGVFAQAASETLGAKFNFSSASLNALPQWATWFEDEFARIQP